MEIVKSARFIALARDHFRGPVLSESSTEKKKVRDSAQNHIRTSCLWSIWPTYVPM